MTIITMNNDTHRWMTKEGEIFIKEIGIVAGQTVADFGCNTGHYAIPAAKVVGPTGIVYAIDREASAIDTLIETTRAVELDNVRPIISDKPVIDLPAESIDVVLLYDVLHYFTDEERKKLYRSANIVLKDDGFLSVFPKHYKSNSPMWYLAELGLIDIINEIEKCHFVLRDDNEKRLIHDDIIEKGIILNFKKSKASDEA